jgi:hypothetical protein
MACVGFFHDDDAFVAAQFPRELASANIYGKNFGRAILQQTIGESTGGRAKVERGESGDTEFEVEQGVFEFVATAAGKFVRRVEREFVAGFDRIARLARGLGIDTDLPGEDGALGLFAAFAKAAFNHCLVETDHFPQKIIRNSRRHKRLPLV